MPDDFLRQRSDLVARIDNLEQEMKPLREQLTNLDRTKGKLNRELADIDLMIERKKQPPRVSDHAVIRFLERKHGFDFEDIRKSLLTPVVVAAMDFGAKSVQIEGGTLKIADRTVTTWVD